jgi:hypothetical protein
MKPGLGLAEGPAGGLLELMVMAAGGRMRTHRRARYLVVEQLAPQISQICAQLNRLDSGTESVGASGQGEAGVWVMDAAAATAGRPGAAGGP